MASISGARPRWRRERTERPLAGREGADLLRRPEHVELLVEGGNPALAHDDDVMPVISTVLPLGGTPRMRTEGPQADPAFGSRLFRDVGKRSSPTDTNRSCESL
jgi:hypothetical protein